MPEKQLICLARAVLIKAKIVVLEEANSNDESQTHSLINRSLLKLFQNCTVIVVADHVSTVI
jgi:ABC-type multidrug transport system fused ATPase/permease subunit